MNLEDEIRRALQDPGRGPSPDFGDRVLAALPARQRLRLWPIRVLAAPVGGAVLAALLLTVVVIGPATAPNGSAAPSNASPGASATSVATDGMYPDGIPRQIGGQLVLRGDAIRGHVAQSRDDTPFLIGGYTAVIYADCAIDQSAPGSPLLAPCDDGVHLSDAPPGAGGGIGLRLVVDSFQGLPGSAPGVFRVHVNDPRATDCAPEIRQRCEEAIVVEAVVWAGSVTLPLDADGIPPEIDGEAVLRGADIAARVAATRDDAPFLIGGWATGPILWRCPAATPERPRHALLPCGPGTGIQLMAGPDRADGLLVMSIDQGPLPAPGAVVLRVHIHDALAASCPEANQPLCQQTLVLDEVVWAQSLALATPRP